MKKIPLSRGQVALVDDDDYADLMQFEWSIVVSGNSPTMYAHRTGGERMHRRILRAPPGMKVDHRNRNGLDNRKSNLRLATSTQNCQNSSSRRGSSCRYLGVDKNEGRWRARIQIERKNVYLGRFHTAKEAALAYDRAAREAFGEFANPNLPE